MAKKAIPAWLQQSCQVVRCFCFLFFTGEWKFWNLHTLFMLWKIGQSFWIKMFKIRLRLHQRAPKTREPLKLCGKEGHPAWLQQSCQVVRCFCFLFFTGEWKFWNLHTLFMLWKIGQSFWIKMFKIRLRLHQRAPKNPWASRELKRALDPGWKDFALRAHDARKNPFFTWFT